MKKIITLTLALLLLGAYAFAQGTTTSSMSGKVTEASGETLLGTNVVAIHVPSGTFYGTTTDIDGSFQLPNLRVGGPYSLTVSYTGYSEQKFEGIKLRLGENFKLNVVMSDAATELETVVVVSKSGTVGQNVGASTQISTEDIETLPTINRDINDFLRLTPQASAFGSGTSFAGVNNRYNAIYIDGAVNNDVFGLSSSGTNGGQTGSSPFSIDIIDQFQVVLSPYDVSLGGFAGGGVNAVTKSGTNQFSGTAYYFLQNEDFAGKTNGQLSDRLGLDDDDRTRLDDFSKKTFGASLGGPIVKDKVFFFANVEIQDDVTPVPFELAEYTGEDNRSSESDLNNLRDVLLNQFNYDPGTFGNTADELEGLKLFGKIDINLNNQNRLTLRHQYTDADQFNRNGGNQFRINFSNNGVFFPSTTNSSAIELNSRISDKMSNNLIIGYTRVTDDRGSLGQDFPFVVIDDGNGSIRFGTEEFSTANILRQKIFTITDNFKVFKGKQTFTFGTHNEFYDIFNQFIRQNFGSYDFNSLDDFLSGAPAQDFDRSYSLVDDITGDESQSAAEFNAIQLGFYAQDEIQVNNKLNLTVGLRLDIPIITDDPREDVSFNANTLPLLQNSYEIANEVRAGSAPDGQLMFSPRVGFEYDFNEDRSMVLRGGLGIFTSRIPFVWPGAMFNNNGLTIGSLDERDVDGDILFNPDINTQLVNPNFSVPSGQIDLFTEGFEYPQVLRGNLALDKSFGQGWDVSFEGIYTNTLNNIVYTNVNSDPTVDFNWTGTPDTRTVFTGNSIDRTYNAVYVGSNTSEGYTYNLTASLAKRFAAGLNMNLSYTYGDAYAVNEGTSSQNSSQWRGQVSIDGRNSPVNGRSDYSLGSRVVAAVNYKLDWGSDGNSATTFSLFYNGQSGTAFSYVIGNRNGQNTNNESGSTSRNRSLIFVPASADQINLVDYEANGGIITAAQQWTELDRFIESDSHLSDRRGQYAEKNGARAPFQGVLDFAIRQDFGKKIGGDVHRFQLSIDIFNFTNLINNDWGTQYFVPGDFNNYFLYELEGFQADGTTPEFTYRNDEIGDDNFNIAGTSSRWRGRIGFRYIFN